MPLLYPAPSVTTFKDFATWLNTVTSNAFWPLVSIYIFLFFLITGIFRFRASESLIWSSFLTFILCVLLVGMELVGDYMVIIFAFLTGISLLIVYLSRG